MRYRMKEEPCKIKVEIPKDAKLRALESAVSEALKTHLTDATVSACKQITIVVSRHRKGT